MAKVDRTWLALFLDYIGRLTIDSKETGVGPLVLLSSQRRFLAELCEGLDRGVRNFVVLKARQLGISTISLAIDLFWLSVHRGMQGALVTDTEGNRDKFRIIIERYMASLPASHRVRIVKHNRNNLVLANGSVLDYLVAGTRKSGTLGRSRAYNFLHATECSSWGDEEGLASLMASLAERNPNRLYLFESTARGFNLFYTMCRQAREDPITQKMMFIGWWAKDDYRIEKSSPLFARYWDGEVTDDEAERIEVVKQVYGVEIEPEQLAWYRWKSETRMGSDAIMDQEYPWTEEDAFVSTGQSFFSQRQLTQLLKNLNDAPPPHKGYAYEMTERFQDTQVVQVNFSHEAQLRVWEEPVMSGSYVIGCDPAYGRSELQDRSVVSVWRCYADRIVQVAEYATPIPETYQVTWVMAHLAGVYRNVMVNLEVTGPGMAIMQELRHLRQLFDAGVVQTPAGGRSVADVFSGVRWYLYHRQDSPGPGYQYNWKTSSENKQMIMNQVRDSFCMNMVEVRSFALADEMRTLVQEGVDIQASGSNKDDRVFGAALAHRAWIDWVRPSMIDENQTFDRVRALEKARDEENPATMVSYLVSDFFRMREQERYGTDIAAIGEG